MKKTRLQASQKIALKQHLCIQHFFSEGKPRTFKFTNTDTGEWPHEHQ